MINGGLLRDAVISAAHSISNKKKSVDELNVFPVPDGDTGTNMSMTITNSVAELENLSDDTDCSVVHTACHTEEPAAVQAEPAERVPEQVLPAVWKCLLRLPFRR